MYKIVPGGQFGLIQFLDRHGRDAVQKWSRRRCNHVRKRPATWIIGLLFAAALVLFGYVFTYVFTINASGQAAPPQQQERSESRAVPVVGSQGRRGILPSLTGRQPAPSSVLDAARNGQPAKNADNKYPCQYCSKTYLHLKHLKRHHLRRKSQIIDCQGLILIKSMH